MLVFDVERRSDDSAVYLLVESWSDPDYFEKVQLNRDYYPPYFAKIDQMMAAPRELYLLDAGGNLSRTLLVIGPPMSAGFLFRVAPRD